MKIKVESLYSPDVEYGETPDDGNALIKSKIKVMDTDTSFTISFAVLTLDYLASLNAACWGFGKLVVPEFDWEQIEGCLTSEISSININSLEEAKTELAKRFKITEPA